RFQSTRRLMILFGIIAGARVVLFGDSRGLLIRRSPLTGVVVELPLLVLELLIGYLFVIPLSWLLVTMLSVMAGSNNQRRLEFESEADACSPTKPLRVLYVRATLAPDASAEQNTGGLATHTSGFLRAALRLGHKLEFVVASRT